MRAKCAWVSTSGKKWPFKPLNSTPLASPAMFNPSPKPNVFLAPSFVCRTSLNMAPKKYGR